MVMLVEIGYVVAIIAGCYLLFFFTGGSFSLFRTAVNPVLRANEKCSWMLAQVYFPPISILYLAVIEKSRKFQAIGMLCLLLAGYLPVYNFMHYAWDQLPYKAQKFVADLEKATHENQEHKKNLKHYTERKQQLVTRLNKIAKVAPEDAKRTQKISVTLLKVTIAYMTDSLPDKDYAAILDRLDAITAAGALSEKDSQEWIQFTEQIINQKKDPKAGEAPTGKQMPESGTAPIPAIAPTASMADPARLSDPLSRQAGMISGHIVVMSRTLTQNVPQDLIQKKVLDNVDAVLADLRGAYIYQELPSENYGRLLNDLGGKIAIGALSPEDAAEWMRLAKIAIKQNEVARS